MLSGKHGETEDAIRHIKRAVDCSKDLPEIPNAYLMPLAFSYYMCCDWKSAAETFQIIANNPKSFEFKGLCGLQLAACYHILGEEEKSQEVITKIPSMIKKSRFDKFAEKELKLAKENGLNLAVFVSMYLRRDIHHLKPKDLKPLIELMDEQFAKLKGQNPEYIAQYHLIRGVMHNRMEESEKAKECFRKALGYEKEIKSRTYIMPCCCQELGEMFYWEGNIDEAEKSFKAANKYSGYDWSEVIYNRIKLSLEVIKKEKLKSGKTEESSQKQDEATEAVQNSEETQDADEKEQEQEIKAEKKMKKKKKEKKKNETSSLD